MRIKHELQMYSSNAGVCLNSTAQSIWLHHYCQLSDEYRSLLFWHSHLSYMKWNVFEFRRKTTDNYLLCWIWNLSNLNLFTYFQQMELSSVYSQEKKKTIIKFLDYNRKRSLNNGNQNKTEHNFTLYSSHDFFFEFFHFIEWWQQNIDWKKRIFLKVLILFNACLSFGLILLFHVYFRPHFKSSIR